MQPPLTPVAPAGTPRQRPVRKPPGSGSRAAGAELRQQQQQQQQQQPQERHQQPHWLQKGAAVIDVCSLRRAIVVGTSSTHCKVLFDSSVGGSLKLAENVEQDERAEIIPIGRLKRTSEVLGKELLPAVFSGFCCMRPRGMGGGTSVERQPLAGSPADACLQPLTPRRGGGGGACVPTTPSSSSWSPGSTRVTGSFFDTASSLDMGASAGRSLSFQASPELPSLARPGDLADAEPAAWLACVASPRQLVARPPRQAPADLYPFSYAVGDDNYGRSSRCSGHSLRPEEKIVRRFQAEVSSRYGGSLGATWCIGFASVHVPHRGESKTVTANVKLGFAEFVRAGRRLGYAGNYKEVWRAFTGSDPASSEKLTHEIFDPEGYAILQEFVEEACDRYDDVDTLWEELFDIDGSGRCTREDFIQVVCSWSWSRRRAVELFRMLDIGQQYDLTLDELEGVGIPKRQATPLPTLQESLAQRAAADEASALSSFYSFLTFKFGSAVRGWRLGMHGDEDGSMLCTLCFHGFCNACRSIGLRSRLSILWRALDKEGHGRITLKEVDSKAYDALDQFRLFLEEHYVTSDDVWERVFDRTGKGRCHQDEFVEACKKDLLFPGDAAKIYKYLNCHHFISLTLEQFEFLGMRRRVVASLSVRQKIEQRQAKDLEEAEEMLRKFKTFLVHNYGGIVPGWRLALDCDGEGKLQFMEFCTRCRKIAFQGNLKALWLALDPHDRGFIAMGDLDPFAVAALEAFLKLVLIFFDDLDTMWYSCLDPDGTGRCTADNLRQACRRLRFVGPWKQLQRCIDLKLEGVFGLDAFEFLAFPRAACVESARRYVHDSGHRCRDAFEGFLSLEFDSSLVRGWRRGFCKGPADGQLTEEITADSFFKSCRDLGFRCNYLNLWLEVVHPAGVYSSAYSSLNSEPISSAESTPRRQHDSIMQRKSVGFEDVGPPASAAGRKGRLSDASFLGYPRTEPVTFEEQVAALNCITLEKLAPDVFAEICAVRDFCSRRCGSTKETWREILHHCVEENLNARIREVQFAHGLRQMGFPDAVGNVFKACDLTGSRLICMDDIRFLQIDD